MSTAYNTLSDALRGYLELTRKESAAYAVLPEPSLPQADLRLSDALRQLPSAAGAGRITIPRYGGGEKPRTLTYFVLQHDVAAMRLRVERITAQRARLTPKEVEGDLVSLLTISADQGLTFDELLQMAVSDAYAIFAGYAQHLPFKACLLDEGVEVTPVPYAEFTSPDSQQTYPAGAYVRALSDAELAAASHLGLGKIYLALKDGAHGYNTLPGADASQWQEQPEYVDTRGRITLLIAEGEAGGQWDRQTLERLHRLLGDYIFCSILAQWYAMCAMLPDMQRWAEGAYSARGDIVVALVGAGHSRPETSFPA